MNKLDYIKRLRDDETYKHVLKAAKTPVEAKMIQAVAEDFLVSFLGVLEPLKKEFDRDPEGFKNKLLEIDDSILNVSGSTPTT